MEKKQSNLSWMLYFLKGSKRIFFLGIISACIVSLTDLIGPKIIEYTVDSVIGNKPFAGKGAAGILMNLVGGPAYLKEHLYMIAVLMAGIAIAGAVFRYLFQLLDVCGAEKLVRRMRNVLFAHICELPVSWHNAYQTGDIIQRCTSDVETIKVFVSEQLTALFRVIMLIVFSMYFMIRINWQLALVEGAFIPIILLSSILFYSKIGSAFQRVDQEEGRLSGITQENLTGVRVVRAFGREAYERKRFLTQNEYYTKLWYRLQKILAGFWVAGNVMATVRNLLVLLLGTYFCVNGSMTAGALIAFISYNALISLPVRRLGRVITEMSKAGISLGRLREIMEADAESDDLEAEAEGGLQERTRAKAHKIKGDIVFEHVSFAYPDGSGKVLDDISFMIPEGTTLGILGGTGSGKSTLMYLLNRIYELPDDHSQGRITIGGVDISKIDRRLLRSQIGMVLQEPFLFSRTISDNISITDTKKKMELVREAARISSLEDSIAHFARGYDTFVGERGITLSGGQKQRVAIAQILLKNPPIMIFDDSLSAVDAETDAKVREAMKKSVKGRTTILIAHRIATLMEADQIIVLEHGKIMQKGTHEELLEEDGLYREIFRLQTQ